MAAPLDTKWVVWVAVWMLPVCLAYTAVEKPSTIVEKQNNLIARKPSKWNATQSSNSNKNHTTIRTADVFSMQRRVIVTYQAMGARCAVAADFDGDGRLDLVSASSNDNAVSWFHNEGPSSVDGSISFSIKRQITWSSLGSRIVTVADVDGDGDVDVVGASYYDSSLRWFENDGAGTFTSHLISDGVNEGQGVTVADVNRDGAPDIVTASSGDNTIAVFTNLGGGVFCELKDIVDDNAVGARTVVAADFNSDGWIDLASASKDDDTVAWYPNDGTGHFPTKLIISAGNESKGAYSLVAVDIDKNGDNDLIVASNGNDHVSLWRNDGQGNFTRTLIYDQADFVLSVTAVDFDRDGDMDVASASFFDGHINWYENVDGKGYEWKNHTIYVGIQGHYVSHADMDGDGDDDLIAVTHAENTVAVYLARTGCDYFDDDDDNKNTTNTTASFKKPRHPKQDCCQQGTEWNGTACEFCHSGTYGVGKGITAQCKPCPTDVCVIPGYAIIPATCSGITGCVHVETNVAACSCPANTMKNPMTDACEPCPEGQIRPDLGFLRETDSIANYTAWELQQGVCFVELQPDFTPLIVVVVVLAILVLVGMALIWRRQNAMAKADAIWTIDSDEIKYDDPILILGRGSFGEVLKGYYRGTPVAIKRAIPLIVTSTKDAMGSGEEEETRDPDALVMGSCTGSVTDPLASSAEGKNVGTGSRLLMRSFDGEKTVGVTAGLSKRKLRKSFVEEMRILSKLRHPCITTVMGAVLGKTPLLVMEWMENGSLRDLLSNQTFPLDPEQTLPLIRDILQGVRFLHAHNPPLIHGDLKCANVLVDGNFRAKIADFGLSARRSNKAVGTPYFMAPEVLQGHAISTQSDVFSFGVLLWEVMTHKVPYDDLEITSKEILSMVKRGILRPDCKQIPDKELVECMEDCWAQDAEKRPSLEDLEMKLIPLCGQNLFSMMQERNKFAHKQSSLLQDVFPEHIAKDLLAGKKVEPEHHDCVSIYFSDIVGFTTISSTLGDAEVSDLLDRLYIQFDELAEKHGVFKLETIGDAWVGATNLNHLQQDHAARIARFSIDAMRAAQKTPIKTDDPSMGNVKIRVGFHSGPVVSSVVGTRNPRYCLFGDTMNTASRMESTSKELRIQCSETAARLAKKQDDCLKFSYRGKIKVKGKGHMKTFYVIGGIQGANDKSPTDFDNSSQGMSSGEMSMGDDFSESKDGSGERSQPFQESMADLVLDAEPSKEYWTDEIRKQKVVPV